MIKPKPFKKLQEEYRKNGINLVWAKYSKKYMLSIINVPAVVQGIENKPEICQLTGWYSVYAKELLQDVENMTKKVYSEYKQTYADNPSMLSYV